MRIKLLILTFLLPFIGVRPALAIDPPVLLNPQNNSTVTSIPTFSWQVVDGSTGYNILIDDEPTVISPYVKNPYYPTNPSYSPQTLNSGTYYWKVKAKDSSGSYGNFSSIWSFTLITSNSTPNPTSSPTSIPTPTQSPTPTPSPTSTTSSTHSSSSSSFIISNIPSQINSDQSFNVLVNLSLPNNPNEKFYLKGAFKKSDGSNYFGKTKVSGNWVKNGSSYYNQYSIKTDASGIWIGDMEIQSDSEDSGFNGTGSYIFKVARYNSSGSGPTWSNELPITITATSTDDQSSSAESQSSSDEIVIPSSPKSVVWSASAKTNSSVEPKIATVAGINSLASQSASPSSNITVKQQRQINPFLIAGVIFILIGTFSLGYIYLKRK